MTSRSPEHDARLLAAAEALATCGDLPGLVRALGGALSDGPSCVASGAGMHNPERELVEVRVCGPTRAGAAEPAAWTLSESLRQAETDVPQLLSAGAGWLSYDLHDGRRSALYDALRDKGLRRVIVAAARLPGRLVGFVLAGFDGESEPEAAVRRRIERLGHLAAPILWVCSLEDRFARGDRRRDTLIELYNTITTSLSFRDVLDSARRVFGRLGAHAASALCLVTDDERACRAHRHRPPDPAAAEETEPQARPLAGSVVEWVMRRGRTYHSEELAQHQEFADDAELARAGVQRYVAAPLLARGRNLGALLLCFDDPHPPLKIDLWLFDNIALQLALTIDNAAIHEQVRRLSDRLREQNVYLREEIQSQHNFGEIIGRAPAIRRVLEDIERVARTSATVLIVGETGVGKELVARAIHAAGGSADQPMVKVNCAAIPEGTVESELFGHERGAFTSAVERRIGRFELANNGTLFLDEIGELPLGVQAKLLRVLQDGEFERVGGSRTLHTNARIIAAPNRALLKAVEGGPFRRALYYRLNVFPIRVPALRERPDDVPALVEAFVSQFNRRMGKNVTSIDRGWIDTLAQRDWPGNIRELRHVIERAMILCDGPCLRGERDRANETPPPTGPLSLGAQPASAAAPATGALPGGPNAARLDAVEAEHIRRVLAQTGGVVEGPRGAAGLLGLKPSTLRFRMKRLGVARPRRDESPP